VITYYLRKREIITVVAVEDNSTFMVMKNASPIMAVIDPRSKF